MMKSLFELTGGTYSTVGDYCVPNLVMPEEPVCDIGLWGQRRLNYLKKHKRVLYVNLLTSGKLAEHLSEIDTIAVQQWEVIIRQMATEQSVTEQLKVENQMEWVRRKNNIRACANKIVQDELIFN